MKNLDLIEDTLSEINNLEEGIEILSQINSLMRRYNDLFQIPSDLPFFLERTGFRPSTDGIEWKDLMQTLQTAEENDREYLEERREDFDSL